jgi:hypothetical protein
MDMNKKLTEILDKIDNRNNWLSVWLKIIPTKTITVPWPDHKWHRIYTDVYALMPSDPNEVYRPWLEKHVGKQHIDWDWNIASYDGSLLEIKFRKGKYKWATLFKLMI